MAQISVRISRFCDEAAGVVSYRHETQRGGGGGDIADLGLTRMYGPSHEERSIFLQVPAVTRSMHPWNLEDPLLLNTFLVCQLLSYKRGD